MESPAILEKLIRSTENEGNKLAFKQLHTHDAKSLTYTSLVKSALSAAHSICATTPPRKSVVVVLPPGIDYIVAFFGCLFANVICVPTHPPSNRQNKSKLQTILDDSSAHTIITNERIAKRLGELNGKYEWILIEELIKENNTSETIRLSRASSEDIAFLQYTSGSTSIPKGVKITYSNLLNNCKLITKEFDCSSNSISVSWLPPYHDMGLIGTIIQPVYIGCTSYIMSPSAFVRNPYVWLKAISDYKATHSGGPNFAYELCIKSITNEQKENLDLSSWKLAFNGAEPVRSSTISKFCDKFSSSGFSPKAMTPCYGLAEATLLVTSTDSKTPPKTKTVTRDDLERNIIKKCSATSENTVELVSSGTLNIVQDIKIIDSDSGKLCKDNEVGEIWLSGKCITDGYWGDSSDENKSFSRLPNISSSKKYFKTGDLGFISEKELFVSGRLKDLIIVNGRNIYPQDIEQIISRTDSSLRHDGTAVFSIENDGREDIIAVQELDFKQKPNHIEIYNKICTEVANSHSINLASVVLIKPGTIPKTSSGKIQRSHCKQLYLNNSLSVAWDSRENGSKHIKEENLTTKYKYEEKHPDRYKAICEWMSNKIANITNKPVNEISTEKPFSTIGLDSISATRLLAELETWSEIKMETSVIWDYPTISALAKYIVEHEKTFVSSNQEKHNENKNLNPEKYHSNDIAIIGIACRIGEAENIDEFWNGLLEGKDFVSCVPSKRRQFNKYRKTAIVNGCYIPDIELFDPGFFEISPKEARQIDPQQRLLLEQTWHALEDANIIPSKLKERNIGVYIGISTNDYSSINKDQKFDRLAGTGNAMSIAANRISYAFDFQGPSLAIDTACSSSLAAIHLACKSLISGESSLAISGGVNAILSPELSEIFLNSNMLSPDGKCNTFDESANGYVRGEGCCVVILKRLDQALADNNKIYSCISSSAINQDGQSNGLTAPRGGAQQEVITRALKSAGVKPRQISYIEAHGTGTPLGDPIEIHALNRIFEDEKAKETPLYIGSVKSNIGHLESAAGISGLIKTALVLKKRKIPKNINFTKLNSNINLDTTKIQIPVNSTINLRSEKTLYAGVSSFGFGGTNAHVILKSITNPKKTIAKHNSDTSIFTISAKTDNSLRKYLKVYLDYLNNITSIDIHEICHASNTFRSHFERRIAFPVSSINELTSKLKNIYQEENQGKPNISKPNTAFTFGGQGVSTIGSASFLYSHFPVFRKALDECISICKEFSNIPLHNLLTSSNEEIDETIKNEHQLATFSLQYSLAKLYISWNIKPSALIGHSLGEYAAACIGGVFTLKDAIYLVSERDRLMNSIIEKGGMLAISADKPTIESCLEKQHINISYSVYNGPKNIVVSGTESNLESAVKLLSKHGIEHQRLATKNAFHSTLVSGITKDFYSCLESVNLKKSSIPIFSTVKGNITDDISDRNYWCEQITAPVYFHQATQNAINYGITEFLEINAKPTLTSICYNNYPGLDRAFIHSLILRNPERSILESLSTLYLKGHDIDWNEFHNTNRERFPNISIPKYPFDRKPFWIKYEASKYEEAGVEDDHKIQTIQDNLHGLNLLDNNLIYDSLTVAEKELLSKIIEKLKENSLEDKSPSNIDENIYKLEWQKSETVSTNSLSFEKNLLSNIRTRFDEILLQTNENNIIKNYEIFISELNRFSIDYIVYGLYELGWRFEKGELVTPDLVAAELKIGSAYKPLINRFFEILSTQDYGILQKNENGWLVVDKLQCKKPKKSKYEILNTLSKGSPEINLVERCGLELANILKGAKTAVEVLFGNQGTKLVEEVYHNSTGAHILHSHLRQCLQAVVGERDKLNPLRILEVGAGTGSTTAAILESLDGFNFEYTFSDISPLFLEEAKKKFSDVLSMNFKLLNIEELIPKEHYNKYDIVVASNVLHATKQISVSLNNIKSALKPSGILIALEGLSEQVWMDITFGLTEGWWRFEDYDLRNEYPLLSVEKWSSVIRSCNYTDSQISAPGTDYLQGIIVAQANNDNFTDKNWLVFSDQPDIIADLNRSPQYNNISKHTISRNENYAKVDNQRYSVNGEVQNDFRLLFEDIKNNKLTIDQVLFLWGMDYKESNGTGQHPVIYNTLSTTKSALYLIQQLLENKSCLSDNFRLTIVTQCEQNPSASDGNELQLTASSLWGFGRSVQMEHPNLNLRLIEIKSTFDHSYKNLLKNELIANNGDTQVKLSGAERHVPRLVTLNQNSSINDISIKENRSYLITGGLGGLGLLTARWCAQRGAKNLVLLGRNEPNQNARQTLKELTDNGINVVNLKVDVNDLIKLKTAINSLSGEIPDIGGVIHSAGTIDDHPIELLNWDDFLEVMAPKVIGSWNLHNIFKDSELDFFLMYSSAVSVLGSPGQANYCAANTFIDCLAHYRRSYNLPSTSISWGNWSDIGLVSDESYATNLKKRGIEAITPEQGKKYLDKLIRFDQPHVVAININWNKFSRHTKKYNMHSILPNQVDHPSQVHETSDNFHLINELKELPDTSAREKIFGYILKLLSEGLEINENQIEPNQKISSLGIDSLVAVDINNKLKNELHVDIPLVKLLQDTTINQLVSDIHKQIRYNNNTLTQSKADISVEPEITGYSGSKAENNESSLSRIEMEI